MSLPALFRGSPGRSPCSTAARVAAAVAIATATAFAPGAIAGSPPRTLPPVPLVRLDGSPTTAAEWAGKPLIVNVWATWCPPCRGEMPSLQQLGDRVAREGIGVVALSLDTDHNLVREFVLKYRITLPVAIARTPGSAGASLGAEALPLTLYVDAGGRIVGRHLGPRDWNDDAVVGDVKRTLLPRPR